jgi:hypothetical protein
MEKSVSTVPRRGGRREASLLFGTYRSTMSRGSYRLLKAILDHEEPEKDFKFDLDKKNNKILFSRE